jgi:hypothetical protein
MKKLLLLIFAASVCCGYTTRIPSEEEVRAWQKSVRSGYDLRALHAFLKATIREKGTHDSVDLSSAAISKTWEFAPLTLKSGDWRFQTNDPRKSEFLLFFYYQSNRRMLGIKCVRERKNRFRVVDIYTDEVILLTHGNPKQPTKSPEPTLTARPFSLMTAVLETPSSLWVSVAHL